jgi:hypothetical protein
MKRTIIHLLALGAAVVVGVDPLAAQRDQSDTAALRANIERRFEVLRIADGVVLKPRDSSRGAQSIEVTNNLIAIDGQPATGPELVQKLGSADADLVRQLSYLTREQQRDLFSSSRGTTTPEVLPPAAPPPPEPPPLPRFERRNRGRRNGDRVQFGSSIHIREGEVVDGDVVAIGGAVTIDGEVRGDVVAVGGGMTLGPKASISDNVVVVGGPLNRDPGARVGGRVQTVGVGSMNFGDWRWTANPLWLFWGSMVGAAFALVFTLTRLAILCLLAALVVLFGRSYMERTADHAATETVKAGAIGLLAQLLFIPVLVITIVILVMTIIGIPLLLLLPFVFLGLGIVGVIGFTAVGYRLGGLLLARLGWSAENPYTTTIAGIVLVMSPLILARLLGLIGVVMVPFTFGLGLIGMLLEYVAWTVGFGAVALTRFGRQSVTTVATTTPASV